MRFALVFAIDLTRGLVSFRNPALTFPMQAWLYSLLSYLVYEWALTVNIWAYSDYLLAGKSQGAVHWRNVGRHQDLRIRGICFSGWLSFQRWYRGWNPNQSLNFFKMLDKRIWAYLYEISFSFLVIDSGSTYCMAVRFFGVSEGDCFALEGFFCISGFSWEVSFCSAGWFWRASIF